jgi:hypothetical protein
MLTEEGREKLDRLFSSISDVLDQKKFEAMREDIILCAFDAFFAQIKDEGIDSHVWSRGDPSKVEKWLCGNYFLPLFSTQDVAHVTFHLVYLEGEVAETGWWELSLCDKESGISRNSASEPRIKQIAEQLFGLTS